MKILAAFLLVVGALISSIQVVYAHSDDNGQQHHVFIPFVQGVGEVDVNEEEPEEEENPTKIPGVWHQGKKVEEPVPGLIVLSFDLPSPPPAFCFEVVHWNEANQQHEEVPGRWLGHKFQLEESWMARPNAARPDYYFTKCTS